jgi:hypothetical protein
MIAGAEGSSIPRFLPYLNGKLARNFRITLRVGRNPTKGRSGDSEGKGHGSPQLGPWNSETYSTGRGS